MAMRDSAAFGSPCEPVTRHRTSWAGKPATSASLMPTPVGTCRWPRRCAICEFSCIPRPTKATWRSNCRGQVDEHLHAVEARGERGDDELALGAGEQLLEGVLDVGLRAGEAAAIDVGAVDNSASTPSAPSCAKRGRSNGLAVERGVVDLEVAGVDQHALRRVDGDRDAVGHAVRDADELDRERARWRRDRRARRRAGRTRARCRALRAWARPAPA